MESECLTSLHVCLAACRHLALHARTTRTHCTPVPQYDTPSKYSLSQLSWTVGAQSLPVLRLMLPPLFRSYLQVALWVKSWDECVFGRDRVGAAAAGKGKQGAAAQVRGLPRVLLLCLRSNVSDCTGGLPPL